MEHGVAEFLKMLLAIATPIFAAVGYLYRKLDKRLDHHDNKFDNLEDRVAEGEKNTEVVKVHLEHMNKKIDKIETGVEKLLDRHNG